MRKPMHTLPRRNALAPPENVFAPRNIGAEIDMNRPKIQNPDGSFSTEETITVPRGNRWYNVPTIVNGQRLKPEDVEYWFSQGDPNIPHVGEFGTLDEAVSAARLRTDQIGHVRDTGAHTQRSALDARSVPPPNGGLNALTGLSPFKR